MTTRTITTNCEIHVSLVISCRCCMDFKKRGFVKEKKQASTTKNCKMMLVVIVVSELDTKSCFEAIYLRYPTNNNDRRRHK